MGVFISVKLSNSITQAEWDTVYEKSLLIAKKLRFCDFERRNIHGNNILCIVPSEEKSDEGWYASGDLETYRSAETQFTPKYITAKSTEKTDVLYDDIFNIIKNEENKNICFRIWGNKTQGEPYHMGLLAIGCMMEQELGIQAMVCEDITYNQCVKAANIASDILGYEVPLPCRCRLNDLNERILRSNGITEVEKLRLLLYKYLGKKNEETGKFIRENYSKNAIDKYWTEKFKNTYINTIGFEDEMKNYFLLGFELSDFCGYADFDRSDEEQCRIFMKNILETSMHVKEKDCEDVLDYTASSEPYGVYSLLASFIFRGAKNKAIDRYIPLDDIKAVFSEHFGEELTKKVIGEYTDKKQNEKPENDIGTLFREKFHQYADEMQENEEKYDISDYSSLADFTAESTLSPEMDKAIKKSFEFYIKQSECDEYKAVITKSPKEIFNFLARHYKYGFLTEEQWNRIYDELERDKNSFRRYFPMLTVKITSDIKYLIRAFVTDDVFWEYCLKRNT